jgi:hypothetical protein
MSIAAPILHFSTQGLPLNFNTNTMNHNQTEQAPSLEQDTDQDILTPNAETSSEGEDLLEELFNEASGAEEGEDFGDEDSSDTDSDDEDNLDLSDDDLGEDDGDCSEL